MKKDKIIYWISTGLFALLMLFSSIGHITSSPEAITFMNQIGYPAYILPFLGWAKVLGIIGILVPGFPRIKEWSYAGLTYDLLGALFSVIMVNGIRMEMSFFILIFAFMIVSYIYNGKLTKSVQ